MLQQKRVGTADIHVHVERLDNAPVIRDFLVLLKREMETLDCRASSFKQRTNLRLEVTLGQNPVETGPLSHTLDPLPKLVGMQAGGWIGQNGGESPSWNKHGKTQGKNPGCCPYDS